MSERDFLVFRLRGPMSAFGEIAVGERRSLWDAPSKSGVLGLLAASLGIVRGDQTALSRLDTELGFAVRIDQAGQPLRDYHTAQAPTEADRTRRRKLGHDLSTRKGDLDTDKDLNTVLSERFYRLEAAFTVALWARPACAPDLAAFGEALRRPVFVPYLGRKACPLSSPPLPCMARTDGLLPALSAYDAQWLESDQALTKPFAFRGLPLKADSRPVWFEMQAGLEAEDAAAQPVRWRRDALRHRPLWQFADRQEGRLTWHRPVVGTSATDQEDAA